MAYTRNVFGKRRRKFSSKRPRKLRRGSTFKRVKRVERSVKKLNASIETKCISFVSTLFTIPQATGASSLYTGLLNAIPQGDTIATRAGDAIKMTSLYFRYSLRPPDYTSLAYDANTMARVMIVLDKNPQVPGTAPTIASIFDLGALATTDDNMMFQPIKWENRNRYKIIYDKTHVLTPSLIYWAPNSATSTGPFSLSNAAPSFALSGKRKIKLGYSVSFNTGTTSPSKNALYVYTYTVNAGSARPTISYTARLCFRDA